MLALAMVAGKEGSTFFLPQNKKLFTVVRSLSL